MTKREFYSKMRDLFIEHFGENFREDKLEIKKRLRDGEAPEINRLYQYAVYELNLFGSRCQRAHSCFWKYNIWEYERYDRVFNHL